MGENLAIVYLSTLVVLLGGACWVLFRQILKTRRIEGTLSRLQNKLSKEKGTAQDYYELGSLYLDKKLYVQAIAQLQKALKAKDLEGEENVALVYNALGYAYTAREQYDLALRQYKEAVKLKPDYTRAWNNLGFAYDRKNLKTQALEAYEEALKTDPKNSTAKDRIKTLKKVLD